MTQLKIERKLIFIIKIDMNECVPNKKTLQIAQRPSKRLFIESWITRFDRSSQQDGFHSRKQSGIYLHRSFDNELVNGRRD